jgi:leader peptidase (prepilin peptidase)/N-methyltransferase
VLAGVAAASPYLAGLTITVPDRAALNWARGTSASRPRILATALAGLPLAALAAATTGWSAALPAFLLLAVLGAPLAVIDIEHHRLPDRLVLTAAVGGAGLLGGAAIVSSEGHRFLRSLQAGAVVFGVLLVLTLAAPFGFGDTKLAAVLAGYLGWYGWTFVVYGILAGFGLAALVALALVFSGRLTMKSALPLGPALLLGALVVLAFRLVPASLS